MVKVLIDNATISSVQSALGKAPLKEPALQNIEHPAPLLHRSSAAPHSTLHNSTDMGFFGEICGLGPITTLTRKGLGHKAYFLT